MAEQDYSRWAAFGGGPPVKKRVEEAAPAAAGFSPIFSDAPSQQMNNSMDFAPSQGAQQEKTFAPGMGQSMLQQASNRYGGGMQPRQGFAESAPQYDPGPPVESSYQNMRGMAPQRQEPSQGFWNDLGGRQSQTQMAGYQEDRGIGKNWGQSTPAPQRQMDQSRRQPPMQAPRQQAQGFRQSRPMPQRRPAPQYRRSVQNSGGQW